MAELLTDERVEAAIVGSGTGWTRNGAWDLYCRRARGLIQAFIDRHERKGPCEPCQGGGSGLISGVEGPCPACNGSGVQRKDRLLLRSEVVAAFREAQESWVDPGMSVEAKAKAMEHMGALAAAFVERVFGDGDRA